MQKVALVTGASRGLGYACALELARQDYHILALARTTGALEELDDAIQKAGGTATLIPLDITDKEGLSRMGASIFQRWGKLDYLIHCAIYAAALTPAHMIADKDLKKSLDINVTATAHLLAMCEPLLKASENPRLLAFEDLQTNRTFSGAYGLSKSAQIMLVRTFSLETDIKVDVVAPPAMPTAVRARFYPGENKDTLIKPENVAKKYIF
jgi:NAD(P)-dependent dehydrogenase (short-subunit alcohol dehydrogenase family)